MSFSMTEKYTSENLLIRTDVKDGNFMNTLQFVNNANYKPHPNSIEMVGSLIDIDTSREYSDNYFTSNIEQEINMAHKCEKKLFFSLLKPDFLNSLKPVFEKGYRVLCIDRENVYGMNSRFNIIPYGAEDFTGKLPLQERIDLLYQADFFIGLLCTHTVL